MSERNIPPSRRLRRFGRDVAVEVIGGLTVAGVLALVGYWLLK